MLLLLTPLLFGLSFLSGMLGSAVIGAWLGAHFTAGWEKVATLSRIFAVALVALVIQRAWILVS